MPPFKDKSVYYCDHCGERGTGKYCSTCKTKEGRKRIDDANIEIMKENMAKGIQYNHPHWDRLKKLAKV